MVSDDYPRSAPFRGEWLLLGAAALLLLALMFGGGGAEAPLLNGLLEAGGALLLCATIARHFTGRPLPSAAWVPVVFLVATLIIIAAQLVPLPLSWWGRLPGRDAAVAAYQATGKTVGGHPLSLDPEATRRFATAILLPAALLLATLRASSDGRVVLLWIIVVGALISVVLAATQLAFGLPEGLFPYGSPGAAVPTGLFANPNHQAQLILGALVAAGLLIRLRGPARDRRRRPRLDLAWLLIPVFVAGAVMTQSRAGIILLVPASLASVLTAVSAKGLPRIFAMLLVALATLALMVLAIPGGLGRAMDLQIELSAGGRITNFPDVIFTLQQFWPWGSGFGTFVPVFKANENLDLMSQAYLNHAHNDLLELLIEGGLPIAALVAGGFVAAAVRLWRLLRSGDSADLPAALAGFTIVAIAIAHSLVDYPLRMHAIASVAAVALGFFVSPTARRPERQGRLKPADPGLMPKVAWTVLPLIGLLLGIQTVRMGLGQSAVRAEDGALAASVRPQNGWGLALLAERQLDTGHASEAARTARAAIERTPLAIVALRTLGRAEEKLEGSGAGDQAWRAASLLGWRDRQVQVWAALRALSEGQADIFAMRADALMRIGDPDELMTRFIRQAVVQPTIRQAFVARLTFEPPWRVRFFQAERPPSGAALQGVVTVLRDLGRTQTPPSRQELRDAIQGLITDGRYSEAIALDRRFVRRSPDPDSLLDDGGFELRSSDYQAHATPFDWTIDPRSAEVAWSEGQRRIAVFATGSPDPAVRRFLALPAGHYRLQFAIRGPPDAGSSLRFAAVCTAAGGMVGSSPQSALPSEDWQTAAFDFDVPARCGLLELDLRRLRTGSADALIDDVRLERL
jgi:O-antigen ligase